MRPALALLALLAALPSPAAIRQIVQAGSGFTFIVRDDGSVLGWGRTSYGLSLLPPNPRDEISTPTLIPIPGKVPQMAGGRETAYALLENGTLLAWGWSGSGSLGTGSTRARGESSPVPIPGLDNIIQISSLGAHALALRADGAVFSWGSNTDGQLGAPDSAVPIRVSALPPIAQVAAGWSFSLALARDGRVFAWGANKSGELGNGSELLRSSTPSPVPALDRIVAIAAGGAADNTAAALRADGALFLWGSNSSSMLGGHSSDPVRSPRLIALPAVKSISLGLGHSGALLADGSLRIWGHDGWGQAGAGSAGDYQFAPVKVKALPPVSLFYLGRAQSYAVTTTGRLFAWGKGNQFGAGPLGQDRRLPVEITLP